VSKGNARAVLKAAQKADRAELARLLESGADLNALWRGYRPLHALIQEQLHGDAAEPTAVRLACFDWLLAHGADPELPAAWPPARALLVAAFTGSSKYVARLLAAKARRDLFTACALGHRPAAKRALAKDPSLAQARDEGGLTALQCAAASRMGRGDPNLAAKLREIARLLLDSGADPNARTKSWIHEIDAAYLACSAGHVEMLTLLLDGGADATQALSSAAWQSDRALGEACLAHGASIDRATHAGKPLLNQLVRWGQMKPAVWLLERGASPNVPDERGWTAVHQAVSRGNVTMLRACLAAGGDRKRRDHADFAPMGVALVMRRVRMAELLAERAEGGSALGP
jgi:ankyrin repeat protein